jgi:hypothetical protein
MRRVFVIARLAVGLAATGVFAGCQGNSAEPDAAALANEPFFLTGTITEVGQPGGYRMRGEPGTSYRVNEAYFRVGEETELRRADGTRATAADLTVGREVTLWITGPIAESYPVQVRARLVAIK